MPSSIPSLAKEQVTENNPLPPVVPNAGMTPELHDFLKDFVATVRQTHENNQLGDSTFNWQVMLAVDDVQMYNLGSQGSFYHPAYGTFVGNYVEFYSMDSTGPIGGPVGLTKSSWAVTNQRSRTIDNVVVGLLCAESVPASGTFGWILTKGVNIHQLTPQGTPQRGDSLSWTDAGLEVSDSIPPFGQIMLMGTGVVDPGNFLVKLTGAGDGSLSRIVALEQKLAQLTDAGLEDRLNETITRLSKNFQTTVVSLSRRIQSLTDDGSSIQQTEFLQSLTNFSNLASVAAGNAALNAKLVNVQLAATVQFTREAKTGRDESKYYSEASGMFSVDAGLSAVEAGISATASAGFEASAHTYADQAGVYADGAFTSKTAAEAAQSASETAALASTTAKDASEASATDSAASAEASHTSELAAASHKTDAETAATASQTYRDTAQTYANNAGASASAAHTSELNAASSKDDANTAATASITAKNEATTQANNAGASATAAHNDMLTATAKAGDATGSASAANTSKVAAGVSESNAYAYSLVAASNQIDLTTLTARVTVNEGAITNIQGKQEAWWEVDAIAGDNTASLSLHADNSGGRIHIAAGEIDLDGDVMISGTLTTRTIASNAITNWVSATGFGGAIDATGGAHSMTMANATITTVGGVVKVDFQCNTSKSGPTAVYRLEFYRDTTLIGRTYHITPSGAGFDIPQSCYIIDTPAAGTYTYTAQFGTLSGGGTGSFLTVDNADIFIQEFKEVSYVYQIKDSDGNVVKTIMAPTMEAIELNTPPEHDAILVSETPPETPSDP